MSKKAIAITTAVVVLAGGVGVCVGVPSIRDSIVGRVDTAQQKDFAVSYDLIGEITGESEFVVRGYYGESSEITIPRTLSLGSLVSHRYTFTTSDECYQYYDTIYRRYADSADWDGDTAKERFNYVFVCKDNSLYTAKSLDELQALCEQIRDASEEEQKALLPMKHDGQIQSYKEGKDYTVTRVESMSNVKSIQVPTGIDVSWEELARNDVHMYFEADHARFGGWTTRDNCLIDTTTHTLKYVYSEAITGDTYTTPTALKAIDFGAFENCTNLKTINVREGVVAVSGTYNANENINKITVNMPRSLQTINTTRLVMSNQQATVYLNSLPTYPRGTGAEAYRFAQDSMVKYVLPDNLYNKLITDTPEFRDSMYADNLVSNSIYISQR